jgi:hypothetical protein
LVEVVAFYAFLKASSPRASLLISNSTGIGILDHVRE